MSDDVMSHSVEGVGDVRMFRDLEAPLDPGLRAGMIGVSRIWVHDDHQRKGVATRLLDAVRGHARWPSSLLTKDQLVFTHTTEMGAAFISKYLHRKEFLVYRPA